MQTDVNEPPSNFNSRSRSPSLISRRPKSTVGTASSSSGPGSSRGRKGLIATSALAWSFFCPFAGELLASRCRGQVQGSIFPRVVSPEIIFRLMCWRNCLHRCDDRTFGMRTRTVVLFAAQVISAVCGLIQCHDASDGGSVYWRTPLFS